MNETSDELVLVGPDYPGPKFGIWDHEKEHWLGDDHGPLLYKMDEVAQLAATMMNIINPPQCSRFGARPYAEIKT